MFSVALLRIISALSAFFLLFVSSELMNEEYFLQYQGEVAKAAIISVIVGFGLEDRLRTVRYSLVQIKYTLVVTTLFFVFVYSSISLLLLFFDIFEWYLACGAISFLNFYASWGFSRLHFARLGICISLILPNLICLVLLLLMPDTHEYFIILHTVVWSLSFSISLMFLLVYCNVKRAFRRFYYVIYKFCKDFLKIRMYVTGIISSCVINMPIIYASTVGDSSAAFFVLCYRVYRLYGVANAAVNQTLITEWSTLDRYKDLRRLKSIKLSIGFAFTCSLLVGGVIYIYSIYVEHYMSISELVCLPIAAFINIAFGPLSSILYRFEAYNSALMAIILNFGILFFVLELNWFEGNFGVAILLGTIVSNCFTAWRCIGVTKS